MQTTPRAQGLSQPAEWSNHTSTWIAWPSDPALWLEDLEAARTAIGDLCATLSETEQVDLLVADARCEEEARARLGQAPTSVRFHRKPYGDIWLRDTGPIFVTGEGGTIAAVRFGWNGWGHKYDYPDDHSVGDAIAEAAGAQVYRFPWILEGGAVEVDGAGTCLTTRQCLLHESRNPSMAESDIEQGLRDALGVETIVWLPGGLVNDHTDGHVDTVARFVRPGVVVTMEPTGPDDPNREQLAAIRTALAGARDARGEQLDVIGIPSPGRVVDREGTVAPASYVNFYIGNRTAIVPMYGVAHDQLALTAIASLFPDRRTVGIDARGILAGGGAFHCVTQQQPSSEAKQC